MAELDSERAMVELWRAAVPNDWRAAAEFLARRFPHRWRRPQKVELTGPRGGPMQMDATAEREERAARLADQLRDFRANEQ